MKWLTFALVALALSGLGVAEPVAADETEETLDPTCVTIYGNPPGVGVDPECIWEIVDDLPP